ncbi:MAG: asparagine synthase C-terminal domain-containing protein, partial [Methanomicrobiales archaeon]|nr:asparagine synthase C-terminal domain-containing protein [Methanomicrobiales archaeon]
YLEGNGCQARDHFGIMPGGIPAGTLLCEGKDTLFIDPPVPLLDLPSAIVTAVSLRADDGVVALSGGVDSALVASLAHLPTIAVGEEGSHDLRRASLVAKDLHLPLEKVAITGREVDEILPLVLSAISRRSVTDVAIATTLFFVTRKAGEQGYTRILAGQGADELFGGYARYERSVDLAGELLRDFGDLPRQLARDQAIAALHGTYFSLPYLDMRVVRAALMIPAREKVSGGIRKKPLREAASHFLPPKIAYYEKKAMQYGSGVQRILRSLSRNNGYKNRVQDYIHHRVESQ